MKGFLESARKIFAGKDELVGHLINTETQMTEPDMLRLDVKRSILASAAYLAGKNHPYTSRMWGFSAKLAYSFRAHTSSLMELITVWFSL